MNLRTARSAYLVLLLPLLVACSTEEEEAKDKCRALVKDWCTQIVDCLIENGELGSEDRAAQLADCKQTGESTIDCSAAVSVSDDYDTCMSDVHATACSSISLESIELPDSCGGVIRVPE